MIAQSVSAACAAALTVARHATTAWDSNLSGFRQPVENTVVANGLRVTTSPHSRSNSRIEPGNSRQEKDLKRQVKAGWVSGTIFRTWFVENAA
jgi:hypothetical protein